MPYTYMPFVLSALPDEQAYSYIVEVPKPDKEADFVMCAGEAYKLPLAATGMFTWTSADEAVASIDEKGILRGNGVGETVLTITDRGGRQSVVKLRVTDE